MVHGGGGSGSWVGKGAFCFWNKAIMFFNRTHIKHYSLKLFVFFFACRWTVILPHRLCSPFPLSLHPYLMWYDFYHMAGHHVQIRFSCNYYHDTPKKKFRPSCLYIICIATGKHFFWADDRYIRFIVFPALTSMCIRHNCSRKGRRQSCTLTAAWYWTGCLRLEFQRSLWRSNIETPLSF